MSSSIKIYSGFLTLLIMLASSCYADVDGIKCNSSKNSLDSLAQLEKLSNSLPKILELSSLNDISSFCRINGFRDSLEADQSIFGTREDKSVADPWVGNFIAALDQREWIYTDWVIQSRRAFGRGPLGENLKLAQSAVPLTQTQIDSCQKELSDLKEKPLQQGTDIKATLLQASYLCKDVTILHAVSCASNMQSMVEKVKPRDNYNLIDTWFDVLKDPIYIKVIKKIALQNHELIINQKIPNTRFFDDLKNAFDLELKDQKKAEDYTFKLLGVLSSNGNASYSFVPCDVPVNIKFVIQMLSLGSAVLDRRTAQNGFIYTYPKEVDSICDYGKNYHFWMTAFLAREAAKESGDVKAAAAAAFTLDKGYQFMKEGVGRDRTRAFKEEVYSNYINNMRLDMTQSAAGAWYGATSVNPKDNKLSRLKYETGMREMFYGAQSLPADPQFVFPDTSNPLKVLSVYSTWKKILNPDAAYKYFETEMNP